MGRKQLLAYMTGSVDQEFLRYNEYLAAENRILRRQLRGCVRLTKGDWKTLAEIGKRLGKRALAQVATIVQPDTILAWHRRLVAKKFDGSRQRRALGRPKIDQELEALVMRMAQENRRWGYDRIAGALQHLGYPISGQTVGNILKRHGIPSAPERKNTTTWKEFIRAHMDVLVATDFFTTEVWTCSGLVTYYVLFFIRIGTREVQMAGLTPHPDMRWMRQRTPASGEGQCRTDVLTKPTCGARRLHLLPGTVGRSAQILRSRGRMSGVPTYLVSDGPRRRMAS
jgi:putative transposase